MTFFSHKSTPPRQVLIVRPPLPGQAAKLEPPHHPSCPASAQASPWGAHTNDFLFLWACKVKPKWKRKWDLRCKSPSVRLSQSISQGLRKAVWWWVWLPICHCCRGNGAVVPCGWVRDWQWEHRMYLLPPPLRIPLTWVICPFLKKRLFYTESTTHPHLPFPALAHTRFGYSTHGALQHP